MRFLWRLLGALLFLAALLFALMATVLGLRGDLTAIVVFGCASLGGFGLGRYLWRKSKKPALEPYAFDDEPLNPLPPVPSTAGDFDYNDTDINFTEDTDREVRRRNPRSRVRELIEFEYADIEGQYSQRQIRVYETTPVYIKGYCLHRRAARTFRRDRVLGDVIIVDTGECIDPMIYR